MSSQPEPYDRVQEMACFCGICRPLDPHHVECERFTAAEILEAAADRLRGKLDKQRRERGRGWPVLISGFDAAGIRSSLHRCLAHQPAHSPSTE